MCIHRASSKTNNDHDRTNRLTDEAGGRIAVAAVKRSAPVHDASVSGQGLG